MKYNSNDTVLVSVPLRGFCFSTRGGREMNLKIRKRVSVPLRGFCFSTKPQALGNTPGGIGVSVPLRGFCFSTKCVCRRKAAERKEFPSPYGDFVFQRKTTSKATAGKKRVFPSPYGDFVFQHWIYGYNHHRVQISFRPLTGILFFNLLQASAFFKSTGKVSVPLRGFCFSTANRLRPLAAR